MEKHYICTGGCKGVSGVAGTCQAEECAKYGEPLEVCECTDGNHEGKMGEKDAPHDTR